MSRETSPNVGPGTPPASGLADLVSASSVSERVFSSPVKVTKGTDTPRSGSQTPIKSPHKRYVPPPNTEITILPQSPLVSKKIQVGNTEFEYGLRIGEMVDSTPLFEAGKGADLLERLEREGYIFVRSAIPRDVASAGRAAMVKHLTPKGAFAPGTKPDEAVIANPKEPGWTIDAETGGIIGDREPDSEIDGWRELAWSKQMRDVYAGAPLRKLFSLLWGQERSRTEDGFVPLSDVTWLRAKGRGEVTAEHSDYYYFKQATDVFRRNRHPLVTGSAAAAAWNAEHAAALSAPGVRRVTCDLCARDFDGNAVAPAVPVSFDKASDGEWHCADCARQPNPVYTCWISLGDYHSGNSSLCVMPRSQALTEFHDPVKNGLLPGDYQKLVKEKWGWERGDFSMGDIILFNVKTVHGASKNLQNNFRFSIDTRVSARWFRPVAVFGEETAMSKPSEAAPARVSSEAAARAEADLTKHTAALEATKGLTPPGGKKGGMMGMGMGMDAGSGAKGKAKGAGAMGMMGVRGAGQAKGKKGQGRSVFESDGEDEDEDDFCGKESGDEQEEEVKAVSKRPRAARAM